MKKFLAVYYLPASVIDNWKTTPSEQKKAAEQNLMQAWTKWMQDNAAGIVDAGGPLGKTKRATAQGVSDIRNDLTGYMTLQAESHEAAAKLFASHPHLTIPQTSIEIMEIMPIPGR